MENKIVDIIKENWFDKFPGENPTEGQMSSRGASKAAQEIVKLCNMHIVTNPVKIMKPIRATYFKTIDELNEWVGDGTNCEIISINYDSAETVHWAYYRLK